MIDKYRKSRVYIIYFCLLFNFFFLAVRLAYLQIFRAPSLTNFAKKQYRMYIPLKPVRGTIFDRNMKPLVLDMPVDSVFANPRNIENPLFAAKSVSEILGIDKEEIMNKFTQDKSFVWLDRHVNKNVAENIKSLNIKGIYLMEETKRSYPYSDSASTILGFCNIDNQGLEGLEFYYDKQLKGKDGYRLSFKDAKKRRLFFMDYDYLPAIDGHDLILTIDSVIQNIAERELEKTVKSFNASSGCVIVMDPLTGEVLAMANYPAADSTYPYGRNRAVADMIEPGSTFKIITASAALEERVVGLKDKIFCNNGVYNMGSHVLHDHRPHGWLTFEEVIELSSNIGTVKVAQKMGLDVLYRYINLFGMGRKTGIDLPGEVPGFIRPLNRLSRTSIGAIPIGQEIMVNALQLTSAVSAIANGGMLVRPYIVQEIRDKKGITIKYFSPVKKHRVISASTADKMKQILTGVVETGTGRQADVDNYQAAGKTGTAQKVENGVYSDDKFIASFIGFIPVDNPKLAISVIVDEPRPYYFGGVVCAPAFKNIARDSLQYLESTGSWQISDIQTSN